MPSHYGRIGSLPPGRMLGGFGPPDAAQIEQQRQLGERLVSEGKMTAAQLQGFLQRFSRFGSMAVTRGGAGGQAQRGLAQKQPSALDRKTGGVRQTVRKARGRESAVVSEQPATGKRATRRPTGAMIPRKQGVTPALYTGRTAPGQNQGLLDQMVRTQAPAQVLQQRRGL